MAVQSMIGNPNWCSLCGLRIPEDIADPKHPLRGTVDHIIPKHAGGPNALGNRAPAHLYCNQKKGHRALLPYDFVRALQVEIMRRLLAMGFTGKNIDLKAAEKRIGLTPPVRLAGAPTMIMQWEDDGGAIASL